MLLIKYSQVRWRNRHIKRPTCSTVSVVWRFQTSILFHETLVGVLWFSEGYYHSYPFCKSWRFTCPRSIFRVIWNSKLRQVETQTYVIFVGNFHRFHQIIKICLKQAEKLGYNDRGRMNSAVWTYKGVVGRPKILWRWEKWTERGGRI